MSRIKVPVQVTKNPNPATKFLKWKSNDQCFEFYDKEARKKVKIQLPFKFLFLQHYVTVKGWSNAAGSGVWSNEVYSTAHEIIEVKDSNGTICKGLYKKNKAIIDASGGQYHRSIYCMTPEGEIVNLQLKGTSVGGIKENSSLDKIPVKGWNLFHSGDKNKKIQGVAHLLDNQWIEVKEFKRGENGTVSYTIPFFELGASITQEENALAVLAAEKLQNYMDLYFSKNEVKPEPKLKPVNEVEVDAVVDLSDLDF